MRRPVDAYSKISSVHGQPTNMGKFKKHLGTDYAMPAGGKVVSPVAGRVTFSGSSSTLGNYYEIAEANNGRIHRICHLYSRRVARGATVAEGQHIGTSGNTGITTGPHTHWDVRRANTAWDASFDNYYDPELLILPPPTAPASHPFQHLVGKAIFLEAFVPSWSVYKAGTDEKLGSLKPQANGGLSYIVRGVDATRKNRILINSATFGNDIALPLANAAGQVYTGEWRII